MFGKLFLAVIIVLLVLGACSAMLSTRTYGDTFYKDRMVPGTKVPCCNKSDCHVIEAHRKIDGFHEILMPDGYWFRPDPKIVLEDVTPDGKAHACWHDKATAAYSTRNRVVFCVWIPIMFM